MQKQMKAALLTVGNFHYLPQRSSGLNIFKSPWKLSFSRREFARIIWSQKAACSAAFLANFLAQQCFASLLVLQALHTVVTELLCGDVDI